MTGKVKVLILFLLCISLCPIQAQIQNDEFHKIYWGISGSMGYTGKSVISSTASSITQVPIATVRNVELLDESTGLKNSANFIIGYRVKPKLSVEYRIGIGIWNSGQSTNQSSSESYANIGSYSANDRITAGYTYWNHEFAVKYNLFSLNPRKKIRFINARAGVGLILNKDGDGIVYREHYWPFVGFVQNNSDNPVSYNNTQLNSLNNFPFGKFGIDYESRGKTGFTFAIDLYCYFPNSFGDNSVVLEDLNFNIQEIKLKNQILAGLFSIEFYINKLYR